MEQNVKKETIPIDFIGIGTSKSATTWMVKCLDDHPDIYVSPVKETHMFGKKFHQLKERYRECFKDAPVDGIKGEYSPGYMVIPAVAERIKTYAPQAKLIVCLRDPIDRITSMYNYAAVSGKPMISMSEMVERFQSSNAYYSQLKPYLDLFSREKILILIYEDIESDPQAFMRDVYEFLEVDSTFVSKFVGSKSNITASNAVRFFMLHKTLLGIRQAIKNAPGGKRLSRFFRYIGVNRVVVSILKRNTTKGDNRVAYTKMEMEDELKYQMQTALRDDICALEKLLGRTLDSWQTKN